jgi:hypothetical protein
VCIGDYEKKRCTKDCTITTQAQDCPPPSTGVCVSQFCGF